MKISFDRPRARRLTLDALHALVLVLSVLLILVISVDTFKSVPFLESPLYMRFQLVVCLVFIADFFIELWLAPPGSRGSFWRRRWLFLLLSVPYLNIIGQYNIPMSPDVLYFIRFVPLARGGPGSGHSARVYRGKPHNRHVFQLSVYSCSHDLFRRADIL